MQSAVLTASASVLIGCMQLAGEAAALAGGFTKVLPTAGAAACRVGWLAIEATDA